MKGHAAPLAVLLGTIAVVGCTSPRSARETRPDDYVSLAAIGTRCGLAFTVEEGGSGVLTGNGQRVVVRDGLSSAVVNGDLVPLSGAARVEGMEARVPKEGAERIAKLLSGTQAEAGPTWTPGATAATPTRPPRAITVVIDPGHGGRFDGARARGGLEEKTVNLDVARRLRDSLGRMGFRVLMTRDADREVAFAYREDLDARVRLAERSGADLFVSLHSNSNRDAGIVGFEVYRARDESRGERVRRLSGISATSLKKAGASSATALYDLNRIRSAAFADELRTSMRATSIPERGVREAGFHVLKWAPCPAALVEMDYLSNPAGVQRLGNAAMRQRIADALAGGIARFAGRLDRIRPK